MKNCASCGIALPVEAPFCGACGARQPAAAPLHAPVAALAANPPHIASAPPAPSPATNNANAATQMGYTAGALIEHMKQQGVPVPVQSNVRAATMIAPELAMAATLASPGPGAAFTPSVSASPGRFAATASPAPVHVPPFATPAPGPAPASAFAPPSRAAAPSAPPAFAPIAPAAAAVATTLADPMVSPLAGQKIGQRPDPTGAVPLAAAHFAPAVFQPTSAPAAALPMRLSTNADPFAKPLRSVMLVFGILCLLMFVTPISVSPLGFTFDMISGGEISALVVSLLPVIVGTIAILFSIIPMPTQVRGGIAAALMLAVTIYPLTLQGDPQWQQIVFVAPFLIVGGLMFRHAYPAALVGRVVTTVGALMLLAPLVVPVGGDIPLWLTLKGAFAASGDALVIALVPLVPLVFAVVGSVVVWIPAPSLAGAKIIAWLLIMWGLVAALTKLIVVGHIADVVKTTLQASLMGWSMGAAMLAIGGYGLAAAMSSRE